MDGTKMRRLALLILVLLLGSCTYLTYLGQKELSCEEIATLRAQVGKEFSLESLRRWIHETYQVPLESIWVATTPDGQTHIVHWGDANRTYYYASLHQPELVVDDITFGGVRGSAGSLIACLGEPALYEAWYKFDPPAYANHLHITLLFPEQGVLASGARFFRSRPKEPPPINDDFPIEFIRFIRPGTAEQVLNNLYGHLPTNLYEQALRNYKPWPGNWQDIVIEIDPSIYR